MNKLIVLVSVVVLFFAGCKKSFSDLIVLGQQQYAEKNYIDAIDTLNLALKRSNADDLNGKGIAFELLGDSYKALLKIEEAEGAYIQAVKTSTASYHAAVALGYMYMAAPDPKRSEQMFKTALQMKPRDPSALLGLGDSLYMMGRYSDSKNIYNNLLDVSPGVRTALKNIALIDARRPTKKISPKKPAGTASKKKKKR